LSASAAIEGELIERQLTMCLPPVKYVRQENSGLTNPSGSFSSSTTHPLCPFRPSSYLLCSHSAEARLRELDCSEAAIGDLRFAYEHPSTNPAVMTEAGFP